MSTTLTDATVTAGTIIILAAGTYFFDSTIHAVLPEPIQTLKENLFLQERIYKIKNKKSKGKKKTNYWNKKTNYWNKKT